MKSLQQVLSGLYDERDVDNIVKTLNLPKEPHFLQPSWHKNFHLYVVYPDSFCENGHCTLYQLINQIPRIKQMGFTAIHILPPFESPLIDKGFDVADYYTIKEEYGGNEAFEKFLAEAKTYEMHVFVDFVLNHISDQHAWFQKAIAGDQYYQDYFVSLSEKPELVKVFEKNGINFAQYQINGKPHDIRIVFPEQAGDIPHWVEHNGNWYYHTFYPQQIDLNWHNPQVFVEMAKVLTYWAQKGCNFRLDAVPYIGKKWEEGMLAHTSATHALIQGLRYILAYTNPQSTLLVEVNQPTEILTSYLSDTTHPQADLSYEFELTEALWVALILGEIDHIWELLTTMQDIPEYTQWVTFIRNHDDLSFKYTDQDIRTHLFEALPDENTVFQYGSGTSGRTLSLLHNDPKRSAIAHLLLASLPGNPAIIYGDEVGKTNDIAYMNEQTQIKMKRGIAVEEDTRDISRGHIHERDLATPTARELQETLTSIFTARQQFSELATTYPERLEPNTLHLFAAKYHLRKKELCIFINLGTKPIVIETTGNTPALTIHDVHMQSKSITLGAYSGVWLYE